MLKKRTRRGYAVVLTCVGGEQGQVLVHFAAHSAVELHITAPNSTLISEAP